ncbi:hypothetical protein RclHR1_03350002 [Rhizophagus clarus]|uniref:High mobility group box domain-containing protein n=1 Tax=Rhizophagus clarus TaxID=94130 RepID=A0A2Z6RQP6_9GLOM|nr:hypothetical protein RclHR1_03350002 [Rhizophagus clarus]GES97185.1 high mobility group box domain-containing protein [Rhizophagus clarus]
MNEVKKERDYHLLMFDISEPDQETVSSNGFHEISCSNGSPQKASVVTTALTKPKKRVRKLKRIPRPPNSFILYRKAKQHDVMAQNKNLTLGGVSKIIAKMWQEEDEKERFQWSILADRAKLKHTQDYPDYVYRPKRSNKKPNDKKLRTKKRTSTQNNNESDKFISYGNSGYSDISSTVENKSSHSMPFISPVSNVSLLSPIDRSSTIMSTTHGVLPSPTNHMTFNQQRDYAQHPTSEIYDIIPHENFISQCFTPIEATSYISPNALRVNNFDSFLNAQPVDKFPYFASHATSHTAYSFSDFDNATVERYDQSNSKLFYYNTR